MRQTKLEEQVEVINGLFGCKEASGEEDPKRVKYQALIEDIRAVWPKVREVLEVSHIEQIEDGKIKLVFGECEAFLESDAHIFERLNLFISLSVKRAGSVFEKGGNPSLDNIHGGVVEGSKVLKFLLYTRIEANLDQFSEDFLDEIARPLGSLMGLNIAPDRILDMFVHMGMNPFSYENGELCLSNFFLAVVNYVAETRAIIARCLSLAESTEVDQPPVLAFDVNLLGNCLLPICAAFEVQDYLEDACFRFLDLIGESKNPFEGFNRFLHEVVEARSPTDMPIAFLFMNFLVNTDLQSSDNRLTHGCPFKHTPFLKEWIRLMTLDFCKWWAMAHPKKDQ